MDIYLCAREDDLFKAWTLYCGKYDFVTPTKQDIMSIKADAIVSPANSFGFMNGGIDLHYRNYFGKKMQDDLQRKIVTEFNAELLVGQATTVELSNPPQLINIKYVISAPTMRVPENVSHTLNAYLATRAALIEAVKMKISSIIFPGMGTGTGRIAANDCAKQMSAAMNDVLVEKRAYTIPKSLYEEQDHMRKYIASEKWTRTQYED